MRYARPRTTPASPWRTWTQPSGPDRGLSPFALSSEGEGVQVLLADLVEEPALDVRQDFGERGFRHMEDLGQ